MVEYTFNINEKGEAQSITDIRAYALQLSALIVNSDRGLPCNIQHFPALNSFYQEYNNATTIEQIHDEINRAVRNSLPNVNADIGVDTAEPSAKTGYKPYIAITIKLSDRGADVGTVVMGITSGANGVELKDIQIF